VVTRFTSPGALTVLFGNGLGGFAAVNDIDLGPACIAPQGVTVADFNRDGRDDIAVTCSASDRVEVLLGDGVGGFPVADRVTYDVGATPVAIAAGFVNQADPSPDLVVADNADSNVTVLLSNGNGTFQNDPINLTNRFFAGSFPTSVAIANVTEHLDGMRDIIVSDGTSAATSSNTVNVLEQDVPNNLGHLQFFSPVRYVAGQHPVSVAVADLNGDGLPDIVVANIGNDVDRGQVTVFLNRGAGIFPTAINSDVGQRPDSIAIADFNGDGILDVVVSNRDSDTISVLLGLGDGSFDLPIDYDTSDVNHPDGPIPAPRFVVVGDFNNDGIPDIAVVNYGTFPEPSPWAGSISIFLGHPDPLDPTHGDGTFVPLVEYRSTNKFFYRAAVGHFIQGDPNLDLALIYERIRPDIGLVRGLIILRGLGNGQFTDDGESRVYEVDNPVDLHRLFVNPSAIVVGDFRNNGIEDIAISDFVDGPPGTSAEHSALKLLLGNGNGTFRLPENFAAGTHATDLAIGDFNGDGKKDLILSNAEFPGFVTELLGNGSGGFLAEAQFAAGTNPWSVAVADFNGDGIDDIVVANINHNSVTVGLGHEDPNNPGHGNGQFDFAGHFATGNFPVQVATADFDNNPRHLPSIITVNNFSNNVSVLLNDLIWPGPPGGARPSSPRRSPAALLELHWADQTSSQRAANTSQVNLAPKEIELIFASVTNADYKTDLVLWQPDAHGLLFDDWFELVHSSALMDQTDSLLAWPEV
jgi:hypothetical protein